MRGNTIQRIGVWTAGSALALVGLLAVNSPAESGAMTGTPPAPLAPTTSAAPSVAPTHPVDCNDPNNAINCQTPPIDSPLVSGTAVPGSPFRD